MDRSRPHNQVDKSVKEPRTQPPPLPARLPRIPDDPGLSSLVVALDPARAVELLPVSAFPEIRSCRIEYIRYKPGTNCIVLYEVSLAGGRKTWAYAKLFAAGRVPRASDELLLSAYHREHRTAVAAFPRDLQMPALRLALMPGQASALLKGAVGRSKQVRFEKHWSDWDLIRYKPERRCVMLGQYEAATRGKGDPTRPFYARFYASSAASVAASRHRYFRSLPGPRVRTPRLLGYSQRNRLLLLKKLAGTPLASLLTGPEVDLERGVDATSAALALWHCLPPPPETVHERDNPASIHQPVRTLKVLLPEYSPALQRLAIHLGQTVPTLDRACLLHGDFYYDQVLISRHPLARFLDLDHVAIGHPARDVAHFCAQLQLLVQQGKLLQDRADRICRRFVQGYESAAQRTIRGPSLRWHSAVQLLRLAIWPFRRFEDGWPEMAGGMIQKAQQQWGGGSC